MVSLILFCACDADSSVFAFWNAWKRNVAYPFSFCRLYHFFQALWKEYFLATTNLSRQVV